MRDCLLDGELVLDKVPGQGEVLSLSLLNTKPKSEFDQGSAVLSVRRPGH